MKVRLIAVGGKMPSWVNEGVLEYSRRLPRDFELSVVEVPLARRSRNSSPARLREKEGEVCLAALHREDYVVALDVLGQSLSTGKLAEKVNKIRESSRALALLVGGPDGLSPACLERANERWSLSALTLPHPLVRVVIAEQLYRVWTLLNNHPYHRD